MANDDQTNETPAAQEYQPKASKDTYLISSVQESLVTALVYRNDENTARIAKLLSLDWFEDPYRDITARALEQRQKYGAAPGTAHVDDVFGNTLNDPDHKQYHLYRRILRGMLTIADGLNTKYLLYRLKDFACRQDLKRVIFQAGTILSQSNDPDDYERVAQILAEPSKFRPLQDLPDFSISARLNREYPPYIKIMGDLVTTENRVMMVGPKGIGKTKFLMELALCAASGIGFLLWEGSGQPLRVLYVDGEMGGRKMDKRLREALVRYQPFPQTLYVVCYDDFPDGVPPLSSAKGQQWLERVIDHVGGADLIIFDNMYSLLEQDDSHGAKTWSQTMPLVKSLTARNIGQIWADHTGHDTSRNADTDKKTWLMDAVGLMFREKGKEWVPGTVAFTLDFHIKDRPADEDNWRDFQSVDIKFAGREWSFIPTKDNKKANTGHTPEKRAEKAGEPEKVSNQAKAFYQKLVEVIDRVGETPSADEWRCIGAEPSDHRIVLEKGNWKKECWTPDLLGEKERDRVMEKRQHTRFWRVKEQLVKAGWIGCQKINGDEDEYFVWTVH